MPIDVSTKDCTALGDAELAAMADLAEKSGSGFDLGFLSKQQEDWVLATDAHIDDELVGYSFYTLERIGGTPAILMGILTIRTGEDSSAILKAILSDQYRKAVLAFPDEDVLIGCRLVSAHGYALLDSLIDVVPRPGYKPTGEERAWGRRLAKRFGAEHRLDDRTFVLSGTGTVDGYVDFSDPVLNGKFDEFEKFFEPLDADRLDCVCAFGWVMAEDLALAGRVEED
ncbi:MAG: hypothetical protein HKL84_02260 [Acidimicrobiaceae bacterium]|nr:hypothetical protein [Acidimicrobiaceae bacterium]